MKHKRVLLGSIDSHCSGKRARTSIKDLARENGGNGT